MQDIPFRGYFRNLCNTRLEANDSLCCYVNSSNSHWLLSSVTEILQTPVSSA